MVTIIDNDTVLAPANTAPVVLSANITVIEDTPQVLILIASNIDGAKSSSFLARCGAFNSNTDVIDIVVTSGTVCISPQKCMKK